MLPEENVQPQDSVKGQQVSSMLKWCYSDMFAKMLATAFVLIFFFFQCAEEGNVSEFSLESSSGGKEKPVQAFFIECTCCTALILMWNNKLRNVEIEWLLIKLFTNVFIVYFLHFNMFFYTSICLALLNNKILDSRPVVFKLLQAVDHLNITKYNFFILNSVFQILDRLTQVPQF